MASNERKSDFLHSKSDQRRDSLDDFCKRLKHTVEKNVSMPDVLDGVKAINSEINVLDSIKIKMESTFCEEPNIDLSMLKLALAGSLISFRNNEEKLRKLESEKVLISKKESFYVK